MVGQAPAWRQRLGALVRSTTSIKGKVLPTRTPNAGPPVRDIEKRAILVPASTLKRSRPDAANFCHCHHSDPACGNAISGRHVAGKNGDVQSRRRKPAVAGRKALRLHQKVYGGGQLRTAGAQERGKTGTKKVANLSACWPLERLPAAPAV